ncbi:exodeoxyribonuclease VII large subunit [Sciscionella marina]|uniref:exodeoxyribonuclease VII large subunit n=1 Tax=Sciscionella marina TaxID=508770 RepID=UPI0003786D0D|nr:exodeoxyribonuclease VII large subunit [Sciscionella marina]
MSTPTTTAENPWPVRTVARKIGDWIGRLGEVWIEGQLTQVNARRGTSTAFLTLRDPAADVSLTLTCPMRLLQALEHKPADGDRVVVHGRPSFWAGRGTLSIRVDEIRAVGIGELLARIERLRKLLGAEGLFDPRRKQRLPVLPRRIGLITGRASAAERDVLSNAHARWPQARFEIHNVAVQGPNAVPQINRALSTLDMSEDVDVIVLARGGGSVEDLLPFSDEALCRAVSGCRTPVVSAVGHEPDSPLCDQVADLRCSTPTDAGKTIVPDMTEQVRALGILRDRARRALAGWVDRERKLLEALRSRPALADPHAGLRRRAEEITGLRMRGRQAILTRLGAERTQQANLRAQLSTLGPAATMARGYAIVGVLGASEQTVLRSVAEVTEGAELRIRLADGALRAVVNEVKKTE